MTIFSKNGLGNIYFPPLTLPLPLLPPLPFGPFPIPNHLHHYYKEVGRERTDR